MAGSSSRLDDSDMLEYLDTTDSDSDFIPKGDTDDTCEEDDAPHAAPPTAHPVSESEEDNMDDEDYREILSPEQSLPLRFQFQELPGPKHITPPDSPPESMEQYKLMGSGKDVITRNYTVYLMMIIQLKELKKNRLQWAGHVTTEKEKL
jgi:hypothetical protein